MAVGCEHTERYDDSKVFFWDTLSADASFVEEIPEGQLKLLENVGGQLVAITRFGASKVIRGTSIIASTYSGVEFLQRRRITLSNDTTSLGIIQPTAVVKNNQLYFGAEVDTGGGIYRFGVNGNEYCLTEDRYITNDGDVSNIFALETDGDTFYVAYDIGVTSSTNRTNFDKDYTMEIEPYYETVRIPAGKNGEKAKLNYIAVHTVPTVDEASFTPATQDIEVEYRVDNEASYTSLGTHDASTQDYTLFNDNGGAVNFPDSWKSIVFRLKVTGLAQLHRFEVDWSNVPSNVG